MNVQIGTVGAARRAARQIADCPYILRSNRAASPTVHPITKKINLCYNKHKKSEIHPKWRESIWLIFCT